MRRPSSPLRPISPLLLLAPAQVQVALRADVEGLKLGGALPQKGARKEPRAQAGRQLRPAGLQEAVELPGRPLLGLVHMVVVVVLLGRLGSPKRPGVVAAPASVLVNGDAEAAAVEARRAEPFAAVDAGPQVAFERRRRPSTASPATVAARHAAEQQARPTEERARAARGAHARPTLPPGPQR